MTRNRHISILSLMLCLASFASAQMTVTAASGGTSLVADKAQNATTPAWTTLGNIVLTETNKGAFATSGTFILTAPAGWRFNTGASVSTTVTGGTGGQNLSVTGQTIGASALTFTLSVSGTNKTDILTIIGVQVQSTNGATLPSSGSILRASGSPGTATINGVTNDVTDFGSLSQIVGAAKLLAITTQPSGTATAGTAFAQQPAIAIRDQFGNTRSAANGAADNATVVTAARSAGTGTLQGTLTATASNGTATFLNLSHNVAGTITIAFTASTLTSATSGNVLISPATASKVVFVQQPTTTAAGSSIAPGITVQLQDAYSNNVPASGVQVNMTLSSGTGTLSGTTSQLTNASGLATFSNLSITASGTKNVTAASSGLTSAVSTSFEINPGTPTQLAFVQGPSSVAAGVSISPSVTVQLKDAYGNNVLTAGTSIAMVLSSGTGVLSGTSPKTTNASGMATFDNLSVNLTGSKQLTASSSGLTSAVSSSFTVTPASASSLAFVQQPTNANAGAPVSPSITVQLKDGFGNDVSTSGVSITMLLSTGSGALSGTTSRTTNGSGLATFDDLNINLSGSKILTATGAGLSSAASSAFTVSPLGASKLGFFQQPTAVAVNDTMTPPVIVEVQDLFGNKVDTTGVTITLSLSYGTGSLVGVLSRPTDTGSSFFDTLKITQVGQKVLTASASGLTSVNSDTFDVNAAGVPSEVEFASVASFAVAGETMNAVTVQLKNGGANVATGGVSVTLSLKPGSSGSLSGTLTKVTNGAGLATFDDLSIDFVGSKELIATSPGLTADTSASFTIDHAAAAQLAFIQQPTTTTAGNSISPSVTVHVLDQFGNAVDTSGLTVSISKSTGAGTLDGTLSAATNGSGVATFSDLWLDVAGSAELTAAHNALTPATSDPFIVSAGSFVKLQLLLPGESASPGAGTGKTGTATTRTAGTSFSITVNAVDTYWNVVPWATHTISISSSDANAVLPANTPLVAGTKALTFAFKTAGSASITATDADSGAVTPNSSPSVSIVPGAFTKLQLIVPGESTAPGTATGKTGSPTAQTAGSPFSVTVNAVDAQWNLISSVTDVVGIVSSDVNATLPSNALLVSGTKSFTVTLNTAGTKTVTASDVTDGSKTLNTSPSMTVNPGTFTKLQILVPGEVADPGSATGKTGSPNTQTVGVEFIVNVKAVDANWNPVSSTDVVSITSSDGTATLPSNAAMVAGAQTFNFTFNTQGTQTISANDVTNGGISLNTTPSITVSPAGLGVVTPATGGEAISADDVGAGFTSLTGPVYTESSSGNAGVGTIVLDVPSGFEFDTNTPLPTVLITRVGGSGGDARNINDVASGTSVAVGSVTSSQITFTISAASSNGVSNSLTWQNVRVRPTAGAPLETAEITKSGTSAMTGVTNGSTSFGTLTEVAGATAKLVITLPGETFTSGVGNTGSPINQTAGANFQIATVSATDQYFHVTTAYSGIKTLSYTGPTGDGVFTTSVSFTDGQSTTTLTTNLKKAETTTLTVNDGSISGPPSSNLTVQVGSFSKLQILVPGESAAPGTATGKTGSPAMQTVGTPFSVTVRGVDDNWNLISGATDVVAITSNDGGATLPSNAALSGGVQSFSVTLNTAGARTVTASDITQPSRTGHTSPAIVVQAGTFTKLQLLMPGETAAPGTPTGKTGSPTARTAGSAFNVTVNAVDANWNLITSVTDVVGITSSDANAALPANAALVGGTKTFSVTLKTAGSATVMATDITDGSKTLNQSPSTTVNAGAFTKLQVLLPGQSSVPGSPTGKTGTPIAQTAGSGFTFTVNAVDADWNAVNSVTDVVAITSSDGAALLPSNNALVAGTQTFSITLNTAGSATVTASDVTNGGKTPDVSSSVTVNPGGTGIVTAATGGTSISADNAGSSFTGLTGPVYSESTPGNATAGTIVLKVADGFTFDTGGTPPSVVVTRLQGLGPDSDNINQLASGDTIQVDSINDSLVTITITSASTNGAENSLTWQNLRVRPISGSPLASDTIKVDTSSTSSMTGVVEDSTNFGVLTTVPGSMTDLLVTLPGQTFTQGAGVTGSPLAQTAGTSFNISSLTAVDQFGNIVTTYSGAKTIAYSGPSGEPSFTTGVNFTAGQSTTTLGTTLKKAESTTISANDGSVFGSSSSSLTVNAGLFTKLQILVPGESSAPGTSTGKTGSPAAQAVTSPFVVTVNAVDANWNVVSSSDLITISSSDAGAVIPPNANLVGGTQTFNVTLNTAGTQTVTATDASDGGKSPSTSPSISVTAGAFTKLQILMPGETAAPGTPTGKTGSPTTRTAGSSFSVTVNAVDANWNVIPTVTDAVSITSSDVNAILPSNAPLVGGTKTFSVTLRTAGSATITATDATDGGKTPNTSPSTTVNAGSFAKLQLLVPGESASPGSVAGKTGSPSSTTEGISFNVTVRAVDAQWNLVGSTDVIGITSTDGGATLPSNAALVAGSQTFAVTLNTAGTQTLTATDISDGGKTPNTSPSITVNAAGTIQSTTTGGLWSATGTWVGGVVPGATSSVVIATTGTNAVTIDGNVSIRTLNINSGAKLQGDGGAWTFTVGKNNSLSLTNNGTFDANGTSVIVGTASSWDGSGSFNLTSINFNAKTLTIAFAAPDTIHLSGGGTPMTGGGSLVPGLNSAFNFSGSSAQTIPIGTYNFTNVYSSNSAGASLAAAVSAANVTGDVRIISGILSNAGFAMVGNGSKTFEVANGATFVMTGTSSTPTGFGTLLFGPSSSVDYQGTNQTIVANNYGNLILTGGTKTFATSGSIGIAGALTTVSSPSVTSTSSTIVYNGSDAQTISSAVTYSTLEASGSGVKTLSGNLTIEGNLTVTSGTLNLSTFTANRSTVGGALTVAVGASLQVGGTSGGEGASNYPVNYGTETLNGTIEFNGGSGQVIPAGVPLTDLVVSTGSTKTIAGDITVSGSIFVNAGTLDLGTNTINRATNGGSMTVASGATLVISGTTGGIGNSNFPMNFSTMTLEGTVEFSATSGTQDVPSSPTYTHLSFTNAGVKQIIAATTANGNIIVYSGSQLDILGGVVFSIGGDLDISGTVNNAGTVNLP